MDDQQLSRPAARRGGVAAALAVLLLTGCGKTATGITLSTPAPEAPGPVGAAPVVTSSPTNGAPSPSPSAAPTSASAAPQTSTASQVEEQRVIAAYKAYNQQFRPLSLMPAADRPTALAKLAADPLYTAVLTELQARDRAGKVPYGQIILHPHVTILTADYAAIEDCQDTSQTGLQDKTMGTKLTVGVRQFKRITQLTLGRDGVWRLTAVARTESAKC